MTISADAGALLVCAVEGATLTSEEVSFYQKVPTSGVTLFTRNLPDPNNSRGIIALISEIQSLRPRGAPPLVIAIDQEGGRVARIKAPFPNPGPAMSLAQGLDNDEALSQIEKAGFSIGEGLLELGINVNFAPVCDILSEPSNTAIGDRAFGTTPESVSLRSHAFLRGLQAAGVRGCLKHFPGQGDASVDTHLGSAVINQPRATLFARELHPFRELIPDVDMVMISHAIYPAFDDKPASRSSYVMNQLLRHDLGFNGVIVTDDMNMHAIPQDDTLWQDAIIDAVVQGADMILVCRHIARAEMAHEVLVKEAERSAAFRHRVSSSAERMLNLRRGLRLGGAV